MTETLPTPESVCAAIVADVRLRIPSLDEIAGGGNVADPADMGPDVALPAIHMHLLLSQMRVLEAERRKLQLNLRIAEHTSFGLAPDDIGDARDAYAGEVGRILLGAFNDDHDAAASALIQAAAAILVTRYDWRLAARTLQKGASLFAESIRINFKPTARHQ